MVEQQRDDISVLAFSNLYYKGAHAFGGCGFSPESGTHCSYKRTRNKIPLAMYFMFRKPDAHALIVELISGCGPTI